jgi:hypothetical protein
MKNLSKILSFVAVFAMSIGAGLFIRHIGADMYGLTPLSANLVGGAAASAVVLSAFIPDLFPTGALFMAITAKQIVRNPNPQNIAGLTGKHYYAFVEDILTFPAALTPDFLAATSFGQLVTIPLLDPFVMVVGKYFHPFPCTEETGNVKSTLVGPTDSKAFENVASFENAGNNDALAGAIAYTANKPVIVIVHELNGTLKVVGTQQYPARLDTADRSGGVKVADGNMTKHSYKCYAPIPCPTYLEVIPLDVLEV